MELLQATLPHAASLHAIAATFADAANEAEEKGLALRVTAPVQAGKLKRKSGTLYGYVWPTYHAAIQAEVTTPADAIGVLEIAAIAVQLLSEPDERDLAELLEGAITKALAFLKENNEGERL